MGMSKGKYTKEKEMNDSEEIFVCACNSAFGICIQHCKTSGQLSANPCLTVNSSKYFMLIYTIADIPNAILHHPKE